MRKSSLNIRDISQLYITQLRAVLKKKHRMNNVYSFYRCAEPKNQRCRRPLTLFSFITATARDGSQVTEKRLQDVSEVLKDDFVKGTALKCKEKNGKPFRCIFFASTTCALALVFYFHIIIIMQLQPIPSFTSPRTETH